MKSFKADYIYPVCADPIKNGIVNVDDAGKIISVIDPALTTEMPDSPVEQVSGIICPGFVNTHCHLELSHLKNKMTVGGGLINFIKEIQALRASDTVTIAEAAQKADQEMYDNGIVAV